MYLAIAGNIGVGKSSLTQILAKRYHFLPVYEVVDENPYLEDFYQNMRRYSFHSQIFFLSRRLEQHLRQVNPGSRIIQDRTIYEDAAIFARNLYLEGLMEERDYRVYFQLYEAILVALRPPDLLIFLEAKVETLLSRIALRGRSYERAISPDYLKRLNDLYANWIVDYRLSKKVIIPTDELDFLKNPADLEVLLARLEQNGLSAPII
jgi:deoxyadenosine/deoxycytidine kinase